MDEKEFHKSRVAFIIYKGEIQYLAHSTFSHEEWCRSLGITDQEFSSLVRGYVRDNRIVYYQGDFAWNEEVLQTALSTYSQIASALCLEDYSVYCGVKKGNVGSIWEPAFCLATVRHGDFEEHYGKNKI